MIPFNNSTKTPNEDEHLHIDVAQDFSAIPGGRYECEGSFSGEEFRKTILLPMYNRAKEEKKKLIIDFDGCYGCPSSFVSEVFRGLETEKQKVFDTIIIKSDDDPMLAERIGSWLEGR